MVERSSAAPVPPATTSPPARMTVTLHVNGEARSLSLAPWTTLLDALREHLDLTGTKKGCDHGQCGACTVLVDGRRINSCLTLAVMKDGAEVTTSRGLANAATLEDAFVAHGAVQCGFCTPGMLVASARLLAEHPSPTREEIRAALAANLCRCTGYRKIVDAVEDAAARLREPEAER